MKYEKTKLFDVFMRSIQGNKWTNMPRGQTRALHTHSRDRKREVLIESTVNICTHAITRLSISRVWSLEMRNSVCVWHYLCVVCVCVPSITLKSPLPTVDYILACANHFNHFWPIPPAARTTTTNARLINCESGGGWRHLCKLTFYTIALVMNSRRERWRKERSQ